jgi:YHS domain-containing protein
MIRKYWWTALVGAALVGCQGEDPNNTLPQNGIPGKGNAGSSTTQPGGTADGYGGATKDKAAKADAEQKGDMADYKQGDDKKSSAADLEKADEKAKGELDKPKAEGDAKKDEKADDKGKAEDKKDGDKAAANVTLTPDQVATINKLPDAKDRELALAQKVCLISGEPLGDMGVPFKVTAEGKTGFLCCKGCKQDFDKDPKSALAKLGK